LEHKGRAIPLVIDDAGPAALPEAIKQIQWVDFRTGFEEGFNLLLRGIHNLRTGSPIPTREAKSKGYVFISYSTEDNAFVAELKRFLGDRGYSFWDFHTSKRNYQIDYTLELEERIQNAEATLSVISPFWKKSKTTFQELHFSYEVNTPVFLLRLADPGPTLALAGRTFIDFIGARTLGFERLAEEMRDVGLGRTFAKATFCISSGGSGSVRFNQKIDLIASGRTIFLSVTSFAYPVVMCFLMRSCTRSLTAILAALTHSHPLIRPPAFPPMSRLPSRSIPSVSLA
jgi:hypothetical protein